MSRPLRLTGSVTALVGLPFIIALTAPEPAPSVATTEAALTVSATAPDVWLSIQAVGSAPEDDDAR